MAERYRVIYADPPWKYDDERSGYGGASAHYPTMKLEDIKSLPVSKLTDDPCLLFCWVTFPKLQEGLDVIKAWGFEYKTLGFAWIKTNPSFHKKE